MTEKDSPPKDESKPTGDTTQPDQEANEKEVERASLPPAVQSDHSDTKHSHPSESEEETDRKQDEAIASLADQTDSIKTQTDWVRVQAIASTFLGAVTLVVLVYHGWIMGKQSQAMSEQTAIMKGQLESMNSGSIQTQQIIAAMQKQAEAATAQATTSESLAEQNKELVMASFAQAEAARRSLGAAQASARAAEKEAQIAQETFYVGDRPYVFAEHTTIEKFEAGVKLKIFVVFVNTGRTPALEFKFAARASVGTEPAPAKELQGLGEGEAYFEATIPNFPGSNSILPAGEKRGATVEWKDILNVVTIDKIKRSEMFLFVYGIASYKDGFGKYHELNFCSFYVHSMGMFAPCNEFNILNNRIKEFATDP